MPPDTPNTGPLTAESAPSEGVRSTYLAPVPKTVDPDPLTAIRRKVKAGQELTADERAQLTAYYARYNRRKKAVHLKGDREQLWTELAQRQGVSLSSWIQERVDQALHGNEEDMRALRDENQRLRDEIGALRGASGQFADVRGATRLSLLLGDDRVVQSVVR